jgi:hypothetical protein
LQIGATRTRLDGLTPSSLLVRSGIISGLIAKEFIMEAERLNSLAALLADLKTREAELRGYL